mgnify:CR=1 FL=1
MALASLPLGITPASAAKVSEGATSSIGVVEAASNAQQFNVKTQGASTGLVAQIVIGGGGGRVQKKAKGPNPLSVKKKVKEGKSGVSKASQPPAKKTRRK